MQTDFLKRALYITSEENLAQIMAGALKRCGAREIIRARNVAEAIDIIYKKRELIHFVLEDVTIFEHYHFFPSRFINAGYRFKVPPPCIAVCEVNDNLDLKLLKEAKYADYVPKPLNESFLEQRIRNSYLKSYQYQETGILVAAIESLLTNKEPEKALAIALPAFARVTRKRENIMALANIYYELKEYKFSELAVKFLLAQNKNDIGAKNMLMKILLASGRVKEANKLKF